MAGYLMALSMRVVILAAAYLLGLDSYNYKIALGVGSTSP
jgi:hypothetical protein